MNSLLALKDELNRNAISRETFWQRMAAHHASLLDHAELLRDSIIERIEITADGLQVATRTGLVFAWDPADLRTAPSVAVNYGEYEPDERRILLSAARHRRTIIDAGANIGWYSLHFAKVLPGEGSIHAFEPVPTTCAMLRRNVRINGLGEAVRVNEMGLAEVGGQATIFLPSVQGSGAASLKRLHPHEDVQEVPIRIGTLDDYVAAHGLTDIGLIKADVEGAEFALLRGAIGTLRTDQPIVFLELLRKWARAYGYHPNEIIAFMKDLGYACWTFDGGRLVQFENMTDETVQTNFIFAQHHRHSAFLRDSQAM